MIEDDDEILKEGSDFSSDDDDSEYIEKSVLKDAVARFKADLKRVTVGSLVSAPYSETGEYYDSEVLELSADLKFVRLRFFGYGFEEEVEILRIKPQVPLMPHWTHQLDEATNAVYYFNNATRESTWARPARPPLPPGWSEELDEKSGETYYWNSAGASTYEKPADFDPATAINSGVFKGEASASASGALYDDEIPEGTQITYPSGQKKPELSNTMREKLINEGRALGADPNAKNPFLPVFGGFFLLVVLGALTQ